MSTIGQTSKDAFIERAYQHHLSALHDQAVREGWEQLHLEAEARSNANGDFADALHPIASRIAKANGVTPWDVDLSNHDWMSGDCESNCQCKERKTMATKSTTAAGGAGDHSAIHAFNLLVAGTMQQHPSWTRQQTIAYIQRANPDAHAAYLRASNPKAAWRQ